jgi:hypothetical protein
MKTILTSLLAAVILVGPADAAETAPGKSAADVRSASGLFGSDGPLLTPEQCQRLDSGIEEFQMELGKLGTLR